MKTPFLMLALLFCLAGCSKEQATAPASLASATVTDSKEVEIKVWMDVDGELVLMKIMYNSETHAYRILYICDGPMIGPIQPGHCRMDGNGCEGEPITADPRSAAAPLMAEGETPTGRVFQIAITGHLASDPDIGNGARLADADGIIVR